MVKTIYLAGLISTEKPESLQWRIVAEANLDKRFKVLSPMRGKKDLGSASKDKGVTHPSLTGKDIIRRDYADIQQSDIILVNLNNYGSTRPMVGTMVELGWAWERKLPVIAFVPGTSKDDSDSRAKLAAGESENAYLMRNHPFISEIVSHYFETMGEAVEFIMKEYV